MFSNHHAINSEKERWRIRAAQLRARAGRAEMTRNHFVSRSSTSTQVPRRIPASSYRNPREEDYNSSPVVLEASPKEGSRCYTRPELSPPSHAELMAGIEGECVIRGGQIPKWFRSPLMLESSYDNSVSLASRSSDGARSPSEETKEEITIGVGCALGDVADTNREREPDAEGKLEEGWKIPNPPPWPVLKKLDAAPKDNNSERESEAEGKREKGSKIPNPPPRPVLQTLDAAPKPSPTKSYRRLHLAVWILATVLLAADRLLWNLWPRQSVFSSVGNDFCGDGACGTDTFCAVDEATICLAEGPHSVKAFDAMARVTGRLIITTANLILVTLCHATWEWLSQAKYLQELLRGWRADNTFLRKIGVWTMAAAVVLHVYSVLLPSAVDNFQINVLEPKGVSWPAQLMATHVEAWVDVKAEVVTWTPDDLASFLWVSVVLALSTLLFARRLCFPRCSWSGGGGGSHWDIHGASALLTRWLKPILGATVIAESFRRRSHPHVWVLNGPVLLWFAVDILYRSFWRSGRISCCTTEATMLTTAAVASLSLPLSAVREDSGEWLPAEEKVSAEMSDVQSGPVVETKETEAVESDKSAEDNSFSESSLESVDTDSSSVSSKDCEQTSREETAWTTSSGSLRSLVASPVSASDSASTGQQLNIQSPPKILRGLWENRPAETSIEESKGTGLVGRELVPSESRGRMEGPLAYISGRRLASVPYGQGTVAKPGGGKELESLDHGGHSGGDVGELPWRFYSAGFSATAFYSSSGRPEVLVKGVGRESPWRPDSDRLRGGGSDGGGGDANNSRSAYSVSNGGKVSESPDHGGHSGGDAGELPWSFYSAGLSATAFYSSSSRPEVLGKGEGGESPWRRDSDCLRGGDSDGREGSVNNSRSAFSVSTGGKELESPDHGGHSGGDAGELPWSFYSAGLPATAFYSSSGRPEVLMKEVGGESPWRPDSDRLCGGGIDGRGGDANNSRSANSVSTGGKVSESLDLGGHSGGDVGELPWSFYSAGLSATAFYSSSSRPEVLGKGAGGESPWRRDSTCLRGGDSDGREGSVNNSRSAFSVSTGGKELESPDHGGHSGGNPGELPWSFYSAGLPATAFYSSSSRPEVLGKGMGGESPWRRGSDRLCGGGIDGTGGDANNSRSAHSVPTGGKVLESRDRGAHSDGGGAKTHETTRRMSTSGCLSSVDSLCRNPSGEDLLSRLEAGTLGEDDRVEDDLQARAVEVRTMEVDTTGPFPSWYF